MLEPLNRIKKLPRRIEEWYQKKDFSSPQLSPQANMTLYFLIYSSGLCTVIFFRKVNGEIPAFLLFFIIVFSVLSLISFLGMTALFLRNHTKNTILPPKLFRAVNEVVVSVLSIGFSRETSLTRFAFSWSFWFLTYGSAFLVATQLPSGKLFGPIFLSLIFMGSYGSLILFSKVNSERVAPHAELNAARDMQMGLLPKEDPVVRGFDISGICIPANEVGGDFFDYVWMDEKKTKLGIAVADVSGKAMKAAITAVMTSGMIYRELGGNQWPRAILQRINKPMYAKLSRGTFTAMSFAVIDAKKKTLAFSNAGQMRPILKRGATSEYIRADGLPLGVQEETTYREAKVKLKKGDVVIFYTDGINEAMNEKQEQYELERLETHIANLTSHISAKEVAESIFNSVKAFVGAAKQNDDMTVVVVKVQ
jgi:hypothetical protein